MTIGISPSSDTIEFIVDLYDPIQNQVRQNMIRYIMPVSEITAYQATSTTDTARTGQDLLMGAIRTFFQNADYSQYNNWEYHAFRVVNNTSQSIDETPE